MRIAFWGNFGTHNLGNECTLHAMLDGARRHIPFAELVAVCNGPDDTLARHRVVALPISSFPLARAPRRPLPFFHLRRLTAEVWDWVRALRTMRTVDMLVMTGTGMLTDKNETFLPYQMFKWALAARICGRKLAFVSVGAEGLTHPFRSTLIGAALWLAHYRSYRDPVSRQRAARLTRRAARDPVYPDLAFSLSTSLATSSEVPPSSERAVAVGIYAVTGGDAAMQRYIKLVGGFVVWLLELGFRVHIVIGDADYDQIARTRLNAWLQDNGALHRVVDEPAASFEQLMRQLAQVDFVVATRFHNVLLALLLGKPVVSVSHLDKNDALMEAMGFSSYCLPLGSAQPEQLQERFRDLERHADELRRTIREQTVQARELLEEQYAVLFAADAASQSQERG